MAVPTEGYPEGNTPFPRPPHDWFVDRHLSVREIYENPKMRAANSFSDSLKSCNGNEISLIESERTKISLLLQGLMKTVFAAIGWIV